MADAVLERKSAVIVTVCSTTTIISYAMFTDRVQTSVLAATAAAAAAAAVSAGYLAVIWYFAATHFLN